MRGSVDTQDRESYGLVCVSKPQLRVSKPPLIVLTHTHLTPPYTSHHSTLPHPVHPVSKLPICIEAPYRAIVITSKGNSTSAYPLHDKVHTMSYVTTKSATVHVTLDDKGATVYTDNGFTNVSYWSQQRAAMYTIDTLPAAHTVIGNRLSLETER